MPAVVQAYARHARRGSQAVELVGEPFRRRGGAELVGDHVAAGLVCLPGGEPLGGLGLVQGPQLGGEHVVERRQSLLTFQGGLAGSFRP